MLHYGIVEDARSDPLKLGRCKVRVVGIHTDNSTELPTSELPWAIPIQSITSAAMSGIGHSATGIVEGSMVVILFADAEKQTPLILGTVAGIPSDKTNIDAVETFDNIAAELKLIPPATAPVTDIPYIGTLTTSQVKKLKTTLNISDDTQLKLDYTDLCRATALSPNSPPEKTAGILALSHSRGTQATIDYIKNSVDFIDENGKSVDIYNTGYSAIIGQSTVEQPTYDNITKSAIDKSQNNTQTSNVKYEVKSSNNTQINQGFVDPNGKYPLITHKDEPDTPRLASGIKINETIVGVKEVEITKNIPIANGGVTWSQSPVPYNAVYPYNHVYTSESGHIMEFDDTKGSERINIHHKAGTFIEIDNVGNKTEKTKGIRTIIVEKDELIYVKGSGHVTIDGDMSIRIGGSANIEVLGDTNIHTHGNFSQQVDGSYNVLVGGAINFKAGGNFNFDAAQIWGNSGASTASAVPAYSPTIQIPAPVTRHETMAFSLEETPEAKILGQEPGTVVTATQTDTSSPTQIASIKGICDFTDGLSMQTRLTVNYTLADLCKDGLFAFDGQNGLSGQEIACNLKQLTLNVIEPLREKYGHLGLKINSCFRPRKNGHSQHEFGQAVDIGFSKIRGTTNDREQYFKLAQEIRDLIAVDQLILEYRDSGRQVWLHISFSLKQQRGQILTLNNDKTYAQGLVLLA